MTDVNKFEIHQKLVKHQIKFKEAKIFAIRKLVRKLQDAKKKTAKEPEVKKFVGQIIRFTGVIDHLKHTNPKRLSLLALINDKTPSEYLSNPNASVEELSVGHFSVIKGIPEILTEIKKELNLDGSSDWKNAIKNFFVPKLKVNRNNKEFAQKGGAKNVKGLKSHNKQKNNATPYAKSSNTQFKNAKNGKKAVAQQQEELVNVDLKIKLESEIKIENEIKLENLSPKSKKKQANRPKPAQVISVANVKSEENVSTPTTVDEFFITADGSNYMSTAVVDRTQEDGPDDGLDRRSRRAMQFGKSARPAPNVNASNKKTFNRPQVFEKKTNQNNRFENGKNSAEKRKSTMPIVRLDEKKVAVEIDTKLHPSWIAKQKLKPTITEFKGTKITFD